ncbi:hypothetical protein [Streptomyces sp. H27-C3]|uniref:hypothetical protein n=1 Tax=Streptomyces sp. H27-C3 TaxID=3046305 RepID=UPI0024BBB8AD|nr:hypothetical protein [Streptomyces sp. H27-C3]MDJ0462477.1 hypothetical protein [Streptomyces sp. H27-C3]
MARQASEATPRSHANQTSAVTRFGNTPRTARPGRADPDEVHDEVQQELLAAGHLLFAEVVHGHQMGVVEPGGEPGPAVEPLPERRVPGQSGVHHLDRDRAVEGLAVRPVDPGRTTGARLWVPPGVRT